MRYYFYFYIISQICSPEIYNINLLKRKTIIENSYTLLQLGIYNKAQKTFKIEHFIYKSEKYNQFIFY